MRGLTYFFISYVTHNERVYNVCRDIITRYNELHIGEKLYNITIRYIYHIYTLTFSFNMHKYDKL